MRKEQRSLHDAVAIQYAQIAMGDLTRGLFDPTRDIATWEQLAQALELKFLILTTEFKLLVET